MAGLPLRTLHPGSKVWVGETSYTIAEIVSLHEVVLADAEGNHVSKKVSELRMPVGRKRRFDLARVPSDGFKQAEDIQREVSKLVSMPRSERTRAHVDAVAKTLMVNRSSVYRYIVKFEKEPSTSGFMRSARADAGKPRLDEALEAEIQGAIDREYLTMQRKPLRAVMAELKKICNEKGYKLPHDHTVRARIDRIPEQTLAERRYGSKYADERFTPLTGSFPGADYPLAVAQIDHTPMDVIVVDDVTREPINRAYLTLVIDVFSRMVLGFYISLDPAGALSTGLALSNAILPKAEFIKSLGLDNTVFIWPCEGKMRMIHSDNAKEFRGTMLGRAANEHGLIAERRPKGQARFGGHVERGFRTFMRRVQELPGTTFSNVKHRVHYDSQGKAVMSLDALRTWFCAYIVGCYHHSPHGGLNGFPPIHVWTQALLHGSPGMPPVGIPEPIADPERLRLDFLPFFLGTVQEDGIRWNNIKWYSDALRRLFHVKDPATGANQRYVIRYDARDLSRLWLYEPRSNTYIEVPYANMLRQTVSLWDVKRANRKLRKESKLATNEEMIFHTIQIMREIVLRETEVTAKAKSAGPKRQVQRQREWGKVQEANRRAMAERASAARPEHASPDQQGDDDDDDFQLPTGIRET